MAKSKRADQAQDRVLTETCIEYITDVYETPDFVQIEGKAGGGYVCYRVYNDGTIAEK